MIVAAGIDDLLIARVANAIAVAMEAAYGATAGTSDLRARLTRARSLTGALQPRANTQALELLKEILAENADEPTALALAAWCHAQRAVYNWSAAPDQDKVEAKYLATAATKAGFDDPDSLTTIAAARTLVADRNGAAVLLDRSLRLDCGAAQTHIRSGWLANYVDAPSRAARHFRAAIRMAPLSPGRFNALAGLGVAHFIRGEHMQAANRMEQALALNPAATWIFRNLIPAYAAVGDWKRAEAGLAELLQDYPNLTVAAVCEAMVFSPAMINRIADGLCRAGLSRT